MATDPTSSLGKARGYLRAMVAASAAFQAWVGVDEEDAPAVAALAKVWYETLPLPSDDAETYSAADVARYWPYALIYLDTYGIRPVATESERDGGAFLLQLVGLADDSDNDPNETCVKFENVVAIILDQIAALREQAGSLDFTDLQIIDGPTRARPADIAAGGRDELAITVRVPWGA